MHSLLEILKFNGDSGVGASSKRANQMWANMRVIQQHFTDTRRGTDIDG